MKILLCNYRYFFAGGPERYMFNLIDGLQERGHEVVPFSLRYRQNKPTPYSKYFASPVGTDMDIYFSKTRKTPAAISKLFYRLFYDVEIEKAVGKQIVDTKPDVAYLLLYLRKLSPSILIGIKRRNIPMAVRLSDYYMMCPARTFLRNDQPCTLCMQGNIISSVRYGCVQQSYLASIANYFATIYHRSIKAFDLIDRFVLTNQFMYECMVKAGFPEKKLVVIQTFVNSSIFHPNPKKGKKNYIAYVGFLEHIKGVHVLIDAFALLRTNRPALDITLQIAGEGDNAYFVSLKQQVRRLNLENSVVFLGEQNTDEIVNLLNQAYLSVVPSLWYENLPNAILESYGCGTPVLASNLGSLIYCVNDGVTGFLFRPGEYNHLAERLAFCFDHPEKVAVMGQNARRVSETTYSRLAHLNKLEALFVELISKKSSSN